MLGIQEFISSIITVVDVSSKMLYFGLRLSYTMGQIIVKFIHFLIMAFCNIIETSLCVIKVLYEDYCIFVLDLFTKACCVINDIGDLIKQMAIFSHNFWSSMKHGAFILYQIFETFINVIHINMLKVISFIASIPELLKQAIIIIGSAFWLALQFIPLSIIYLVTMTIYFIGRSYEEVYSLLCTFVEGAHHILNTAIQFFVDIPTEALLGLLFGVFVCVACVKYISNVTHYGMHFIGTFQRHVRYFSRQVWHNLEMLILWNFTNQIIEETPDVTDDSTDSEESVDVNTTLHLRSRIISRDESNKSVHNSREQLRRLLEREQEEKLCIVCQDKGKSVIILPCRHLCLCANCCVTIQRQQGVCPICREPVRRVMKVYL